jgi:hypothetical protein
LRDRDPRDGEIRVKLVYIYVRWKIDIGPPIGPLKIGSCLGLALWAEVAAQALSAYRAVPALSTIDCA